MCVLGFGADLDAMVQQLEDCADASSRTQVAAAITPFRFKRPPLAAGKIPPTFYTHTQVLLPVMIAKAPRM